MEVSPTPEISTQENSNPENNTPVTFAGAEVASIGETKYASLQEALNNASEGDTVTLLSDTTEDVEISSKNFILDLGGKTLTNTNSGKATLTLLDGATVKVQNGTINGGTSYYNIYGAENCSTDLTLENVNANAGNNESSMLNSYGNVHIISGNYIGGLNTVLMQPGSNLTIEDGYFELNASEGGITANVFNYGTAIINGGKFVQNAKPTYAGPMNVYGLEKDNLKSSTTINGGTFINNHQKSGSKCVSYQVDSDMVSVLGGSFNKSSVLSYIVREGNYYFKEGSMYVVRKPKLTVYVNGTQVDSYEYNANSNVEFNGNNYLKDNEVLTGVYTNKACSSKYLVSDSNGKYTLKTEEALYIKTAEKLDNDILLEKEIKVGNTVTDINSEVTAIKKTDISKNLSKPSSTMESQTLTNSLLSVTEDEIKNIVENDSNNILKVTDINEAFNQVKVVSQIYYDVKVTGQVLEDDKRVLSFDITPMMQLYVMNKIENTISVSGSTKNVIALNNPIPLTDINVGEGIEMKVPVGTLFSGIDDLTHIYVRHEHNGNIYSYPATYDSSSKTVSFVNTHGFSKFTVTLDAREGKLEYSELNKTVTVTPSSLSDELEKINDTRNKKFIGWKYSGKVYTTLTDELLDYASEQGLIKLTPVYEEVKDNNSFTTASGYDDGSPFTTDTCGNVFDRWGNAIYEVKGCNVGGYNLVRTSTN